MQRNASPPARRPPAPRWLAPTPMAAWPTRPVVVAPAPAPGTVKTSVQPGAMPPAAVRLGRGRPSEVISGERGGIQLASRMAAASFTSQASARQHWSSKLPSRSTRAELARPNFRPTHHTSEKDNTEHTSTRIAHKTPHSSMSMPHIFSEPRGPPGFGSAIRYPLSALAARRRPRSRHYSPPTYCAIARSPPWARGYHNHRSPVPPLGTSNGTVDACMIQSKMLRSISLGSGRGVHLLT